MPSGVGGVLFGKWGLALKTLARAPKDLAEAKHKALLQEAEFFRTKIVEGLREQAPGGRQFKPLSPTTIAMRQFLGFKGTKALLRRGDLRNAIAVQEVGDAVFVGIRRTAKNSQGEALVDIAQLNEHGSKPIVIRITPKMAALLHMAFRKSGNTNRMGPPRPSTGIITIQIPARPFLAPVFEKFGQPEESSKRFAERVAKLMKGKGPWAAIKL